MKQDGIHYTLQFDVPEANMPEFASLAQQACDTCEPTEPGTLVYRWQIDDSGSRVQLHERFTDEAAMLAHLGGPAATEIFPKLMAISEVTRFDVHGDPSAAAAETLAAFGATTYGQWKGFDR
jgi:quinol monooxygenase YgiN